MLPADAKMPHRLLLASIAVLLHCSIGGECAEGGPGRRGGGRPCPEALQEFMPGSVVREDGSAWDPETSTLYPNGTFWIVHDVETNETNVFGCPCNLGRPCLRKCCQMGMALDSNGVCVERENATLADGGSWFKPVLSERHGKNVISVDGNAFRLGLLTDKPCRHEESKELRLLNESESYIRASDASLCIIGEEKEECMNVTNFCHDYIVDKGTYESIFCPPKKKKDKGWSVKFQHTKEEHFIVNVFKYFTQTISSIALLFMVILYAAAPELRSLHGKCHMSHAISLLIYYSLQSLLMYGSESLRTAKGICFLLGPGEIYFYLAPLTWLNVMSIDIMMAFLCLRPIMPGGKHEDLRKFILYSSYAWGAPMLILLVTVIKDFTKEVDQQPTVDDWCTIGTFRNWNYRKYPMYTLLSINGLIFGLTAFKIYSLKRDTSKSMSHDSRRHSRDGDNGNARTKMYFRLLLLMGFHWVLEPVTKALHTPFRLNKKWYLRVIWYLFALVNRLQGVFILIMFMGNARLTGSVWRKLFKSRLWANITSKIIEVSSSSNKTSSGIELEEASSSSKAGNPSKRTSNATLVDMGDFSPGPTKGTRSQSIDAGQIPTVSGLVESKVRRWSTDTCCTDIESDTFTTCPDASTRKRKESISVSFKLQDEGLPGLSVQEGIEEEHGGESISLTDESKEDQEQKDASSNPQHKNESENCDIPRDSMTPMPSNHTKDDTGDISSVTQDNRIGTKKDTENLVT
ncbi:G-protein coupled receptor Mth2-like [Ischnura elegans]|uniref:G-protein coupled receptor Mth2-like n=1 Tax=Ischnura elegans TaxID=197161 RepID=UPI001ED8A652|nr:G-protein coupled receptor Mth2-like [Ischnura elegans]